MQTHADVLDFEARYAVDGYGGIAFYLTEQVDEDWVRAVMVGDDTVHLVEISCLTKLDEDAYCGGCGQIGCTWG